MRYLMIFLLFLFSFMKTGDCQTFKTPTRLYSLELTSEAVSDTIGLDYGDLYADDDLTVNDDIVVRGSMTMTNGRLNCIAGSVKDIFLYPPNNSTYTITGITGLLISTANISLSNDVAALTGGATTWNGFWTEPVVPRDIGVRFDAALIGHSVVRITGTDARGRSIYEDVVSSCGAVNYTNQAFADISTVRISSLSAVCTLTAANVKLQMSDGDKLGLSWNMDGALIKGLLINPVSRFGEPVTLTDITTSITVSTAAYDTFTCTSYLFEGTSGFMLLYNHRLE